MSVMDSLGFSLNWFNIPLTEWNKFNDILKERIQNENYDLRSLIKILNSISN